jgi:hypothetical protein
MAVPAFDRRAWPDRTNQIIREIETGDKACCLDSGRYDGANRNDYFQGVSSAPARRREGAEGLFLTGPTKSVE